jgi:hypothetical protein
MPKPKIPHLYSRNSAVDSLDEYYTVFWNGKTPHETLVEFEQQSDWVDQLFMYFVIGNIPTIILIYSIKYFVFGDVNISIAGFIHLMYTSWSILFIAGMLIYRKILSKTHEKLEESVWLVGIIDTYQKYISERKDVETLINEIQKLNESEKHEIYQTYFKPIFQPVNPDVIKDHNMRWKNIDIVSDND